MTSRQFQVRRLFDQKSGSWKFKYCDSGALAPRIHRFGMELDSNGIDPANFRRVLDFGCGSGDLTATLCRRGYTATGCDVSLAMIDEAVRRWKDLSIEWRLLKTGADVLPFDDACFDVVIASSVLEYVDAPEGILRELARVLRNGGVLLATVPDVTHRIRKYEWLTQEFMKQLGGISAYRLGSYSNRFSEYVCYLQCSLNRFSERAWYDLFEVADLCELRRSRPENANPLLMLRASKS